LHQDIATSAVVQNFRNLAVWSKAHIVATKTYRLTRGFPREEMFGLSLQMRRAALSVAANIAEGCGRSGDREFARFLRIALGSASELEYYLLFARELALASLADIALLERETGEVKRMLTRLTHRLSNRTRRNERTPMAESYIADS
jgi:four helix bundle protein